MATGELFERDSCRVWDVRYFPYSWYLNTLDFSTNVNPLLTLYNVNNDILKKSVQERKKDELWSQNNLSWLFLNGPFDFNRSVVVTLLNTHSFIAEVCLDAMKDIDFKYFPSHLCISEKDRKLNIK